jgi:hypothetical protein
VWCSGEADPDKGRKGSYLEGNPASRSNVQLSHRRGNHWPSTERMRPCISRGKSNQRPSDL